MYLYNFIEDIIRYSIYELNIYTISGIENLNRYKRSNNN